ncbi:MAG: tetratricopeptide repeat protein [Chlamydiota bacterium]
MRKFSCKMAKLLSFSLASSIILSLSPAQPPSQDVPLLKRIRDYWKEGDFSLAKKQIGLYLEKNPTGALSEELHLLLGDLYLQEGNFTSALEEYALLERKDLKEQSFYNEALCLYETKNYKDLLNLTEILSSQKQLTPNQVHSVRYLCAVSLYESKDPSVFHKAVSLFESCKQTSFYAQALPSLISLYLSHEEQEKAIECYLALAKIDTTQAPDLIFQAAILQAKINPSDALELFQNVLCSSSSYKPAAAYNTLILLYQTGRFKELIQTHEETHLLFSSKEQEEASYLTGKSLHHLQENEKAITYLIQATENANFSEEMKLEAGLMALTSASHLKNANLYKEIWDKVATFSLKEDIQIQTHLTYLNLLKPGENKEELARASQHFIQQFPSYADLMPIQLGLIHGLYGSKQWESAKTALHAFINAYPNNFSSELLRLQMDCYSNLLKENPSCRKEWITTAQSTLQVPNLLSSSEREHYLLELTKNIFLEEQFPEALYVTQEFVAEFPSSSSLEEVQLIQALCYLSDSESHLLFALHAENFLESYPQNEQSPTLRIQLFNTYLKQATSVEEPLQTELLDKAANHLYIVFSQKEHKIQKENIKWLAEYYYQLPSYPKAITLFETLLQDPSLEGQTEDNVYKLSTLFSKNLELEKKVLLLEGWISNKPSLQTSLQKHFIFDLAGTYKALNNSAKALELYDLLILSDNHSRIGAESTLERCKILFSRLKEDEKIEDNPLCMEILHLLKDLENQKNISLEPLHLEAGLEYVECKASLIKDPSLRLQKKQELLKLCQENFQSSYEAKDLAEKKELFLVYEQFIQAQILLCNPESSENKDHSALLLHNLQGNPLTPAPLQLRIKTSLELKDLL